MTFSRVSLRLSLLCGLSAMTMAPALAQQVSARPIHIAHKSLAEALTELAGQTGINILFRPADVAGLSSPALNGRMSAAAAVQRMIEGTRLELVVDANGGLLVRVREETGAVGAEGGEIVVTARKVEERLKDVPIAISAFGGKQLRDNGHIRLEEMGQFAPNTSIVISNGHQSSIAIRGLGTNPGNDGLEGSTGVFLDGVYLGRPGMVSMDLIDIQQLEVLRGPQGTLFGKNTTAGAINITTALPSFRLGFQGQASFGNFGYQQYQGSLTGPITDTLAARITAYGTTRDGTTTDIHTNTKISTLNRSGVRGQLLYKPSDDFSIRLIGEYSREQQSTGAVQLFNRPSITPAALQTKLDATGATIVFDPRGRTTTTDGPVETGVRQTAFSAEINWKIADFTLTSISAYRRWIYRSFADSDGTSADFYNAGFDIHDNQYSQEIRLTFPHMGQFDAIAGLYYFNQKIDVDGITSYGSDSAAWLAGLPLSTIEAAAPTTPKLAALLAYNNSRWDNIAVPVTNSYAAFGQATWHATSRWNLTAGVRVTHEAKHETVSRPNPYSTLTGLPVAGLASSVVAPVYLSTSDTAPSFLFSTDYHLDQDVMLYGLISRGQKAGGLNTTPPTGTITIDNLKIRPEVATNYEIGMKGDVLDHHLAFSASLFLTNVTGYQATYIAPVGAGSAIVTLLTNAGKVQTKGFEAEATLVPVPGMSLRGFVGYTDARYKSYTNGPCPLEITGQSFCDLTGKPVSGTPKWSTGITGNYVRGFNDRIDGYLNAEFSWKSAYFGSLDDSIYSKTGNYGILNLRAGIRSHNERWDISVWGKNITNQAYVTTAANFNALVPGLYLSTFGDPRTYGVTLRTTY